MTLPDGRSLSLLQASTDSGACCAHAGESLILWSQGGSAFFEDKRKRVYGDCRRLRRA
jgi:membrane-bound inhibitor of C-type lysozyme